MLGRIDDLCFLPDGKGTLRGGGGDGSGGRSLQGKNLLITLSCDSTVKIQIKKKNYINCK